MGVKAGLVTITRGRDNSQIYWYGRCRGGFLINIFHTEQDTPIKHGDITWWPLLGPASCHTYTPTVYRCAHLWWKDVISLLQEVCMQDIFHWEGCQGFPLYPSLTLLSPLLYIVSFLCRSASACMSMHFHSLPLCVIVSPSLLLSVCRIQWCMAYRKFSLLGY